MTKVLIVIPARFASERFPAKVLADLEGKPMIQWVWEKATAATRADDVIIATDNERVEKAAQAFGAKVVMTSASHRSGTERAAEVATKFTFDIVVNLQGDEPLFAPQAIDQLINALKDEDTVQMASLRVKLQKYEEYLDPNVVKVVCDDQGYALYFSRSPLPFYRGQEVLLKQWKEQGVPPAVKPAPYKHLGIYAYRTDFLIAFSGLPQCALEQAEKLEQLRALAWGFKIKVPETEFDSVSVDVKEDLEKVVAIIRRGKEK